jgi:hypothetical protein
VSFICTNYPAVRTAVGQAIASDFIAEASALVDMRQGDTERGAKRARLDPSTSDCSTVMWEGRRGELQALLNREQVINLWDPIYRKDMTPLVGI